MAVYWWLARSEWRSALLNVASFPHQPCSYEFALDELHEHDRHIRLGMDR